jgi:alginate O-acetyltransferase complex protein AlgI
MTFIQVEFLVFFAVVYASYWLVGDRRIQNAILAVSSAVFYGWVHPWFLILLYGSALLDYGMGLLMHDRPEQKKVWLTISMAGNLGMLGYFKYCDFFIENVIAAFGALGIETNLHTLGIFLPVGISFYTFQTMSYTLDIYRGQLEPRRNFLDYIVFVSFFPQLVAGPVERARDLLPQMEVDRVFSLTAVRSGVALAAWGAFKKVCVADTIAPYVDKVFVLNEPTFALIALASVGFSIQILADFSGYTDIARGISRMMGFELVENFKHPYLAVDPSDFWRRWHVSFSTWIRDYVYIAVGGSKGPFWFTVRSTFIAMLVSGLWHGASWNFVLWGAFHATLITGYRIVEPRLPAAVRGRWFSQPAAIAIMYVWTCVGWLIFRETRIDRLLYYATLPPLGGTHEQWVATVMFASAIAVVATPLLLALAGERWIKPRLEGSPWFLPVQTSLWATYAVAILSLMRTNNNDFIYFQF